MLKPLRSLAVLFCLASVGACGSPAEEMVILDLARDLRAARVEAESRGGVRPLDPSTQGEHRVWLPAGQAVEFALVGSGAPFLELALVVGEGEPPSALRLEVWAMTESLSTPPRKLDVPDLRSAWLGAFKGRVPLPASSVGWRLRLSSEVPSPPGREEGFLLEGARVVVAAEGEAAPVPRGDSRPSLVVFMVDTLRQDRLGCYGDVDARTPAIDRFCEQAIRFTRAEAHASWTRATVASVFTGLEPPVHATIDRGDGLPQDVPLLAELLHEAGYDTKAVFTNSNAGPDAGFGRGFDHIDHLREEVTPEIHQPARRVVDLAAHWLEGRASSDPFLLYLHVTDPHDPYLPPSPFGPSRDADGVPGWLGTGNHMRRLERGEVQLEPDQLVALQALYAGEIEATDAAFGRLLQTLERLGHGENTAILLVADHGEEFLDHGRWTHAKSLWSEMLSIPFILELPGGRLGGTAVPSLVRQVDVLPTLLELAEVEEPPGLHGRSVLPLLGEELRFRPAFGYHDLAGSTLRSVRIHDLKLVGRARPDRTFEILGLYDLAVDPAETRDVAAEHPEWVRYLELLWLDRARDRARRYRPTEIPRHFEVQAQLEALGYL